MKNALLLMAYGSPERKEDIMEYLTDVFGGRQPPAFSVEETENKYKAFGYKSPSNKILDQLMERVKREIVDCEPILAFKHWKPGIGWAMEKIKEGNYDKTYVLPLFPVTNTSVQNSYIESVNKHWAERRMGGKKFSINGMTQAPSLTDFWVESIKNELREGDFLLFTAHSLPYTEEQERKYVDILREWTSEIAKRSGAASYDLGFQSRGTYGKIWLTPSVYDILDMVKDRGFKRIVTAPIGFLYDHLEVLYDLDTLFGNKVRAAGIDYKRAKMPNDSDYMVKAIRECITEVENVKS